MITNVSILLDKRYCNARNEYPVKVAVNFWLGLGKQKRLLVSIGKYFSEKEFAKVRKAGTPDYALINDEIEAFRKKAASIPKEVSPDVFKELFSGEQKKVITVIDLLERKISEAKE